MKPLLAAWVILLLCDSSLLAELRPCAFKLASCTRGDAAAAEPCCLSPALLLWDATVAADEEERREGDALWGL